MQIVKPEVSLVGITPNAAQMIELAGRTAYKSEDKITDTSAEDFVRMIITRGHEAVIEHASGWRLEYDETTRRYALFAPHADEQEVIRELTPGSGEVALRLIDAAVEWIQDNAADRGLPGLI